MANIYPNSSTAQYCNWLLANSLIRLTAPRKVQVQNILTAANTGGYVAQLYYEEFVQYTNQWYYQYQQYLQGYQSAPMPTTYDALTTAWLAKVTSPAQQTIYAVDAFFKQLRADGNLLLDAFWLFAQDNQTNARVSLFNPGSFGITEHGTPVWTSNLGYTCNGSSMYLSTGFIPSSSGTYYTQNSAMIGTYTRNSVAGQSAASIGAYDGLHTCHLDPRTTTGVCIIDMNSATDASGASAGTQGVLNAIRTASNAVANYANGSSVFTATTSSTGSPSVELYVMAQNNTGTPVGFWNNQVAAAWAGSGAVNQTLFNSAVNLLMTNLGAHY